MLKYSFLLCSLLCLWGCGAFTLHRKDIVGHWKLAGHGIEGEITLYDDETITGTNIPLDAICDRAAYHKPNKFDIKHEIIGNWYLDEGMDGIRFGMEDRTSKEGCMNLFTHDISKYSGEICNTTEVEQVCYTLKKYK